MNLMNYYSHNIGDFAAKTRFMSPEEIGIYVILKDEYLRCGMRLACGRIANMMPPGCEASLKRVLERFFVVEDGFYVCEEFEKELSDYKEKASTNAENAKNGWEKRRKARKSKADSCESHADGMQIGCDSHADGMQIGCDSHADGCLTNNQEPITNNQLDVVNDTTCHMSEETSDDGLFGEEQVQKPEHSGVPNCPTQKIVDLYHQILPELPKVTLITSARQTLTRSRWRDLYGAKDFETMEQGLEVFKTYFEIVKSRDFLMGRCKPSGGREVPFRATYDWLMKQGNFMKVCEGNYVNSRRK